MSIGIVERLRFDAVRCETQFSKGVAGNIEEAANEIERLREALETADDVLSMIQGAAVKGVPHGMDINNVRAIIATALRAKVAALPNGER